MIVAREIETGKIVSGAEAIRQLSAGTAYRLSSEQPEMAVSTEKREVAALRVSRHAR